MILLLIFAFCAVCHADKLDRTYLPPPGSKYAGGSPDAILPPIELPKGSSYSTNAPIRQSTEFEVSQPAGTYQQGIPHHGRPGLHQENINQSVNFATQAPTRFGSSANGDQFSQVPTDYTGRPDVTNQPGFTRSQGPTTSLPPSVYRNSYPTTSTAYAFTQTTTYTPVEEQGCVGQNCAYTPSGPGLVDSGIEPQISISQHAPERIANIPNNQFGSTERPLQIQQQGYPQQYQYTSSSQAPTNLLTQPGVQSQYSNQNSQSLPTTILPQHNLENNYGSSLNTPQPNFPSQQRPTTPQQHNIGYQPSFPGQSVDMQTHGASPQYSATVVQKVNQQVNPSVTSSGQPGYFNQADQRSGDRTQNRFDATHPQATLPKSHTAASSTGFRPSNYPDSRLTDAVYGSSTPFPVTSSPSFETGLPGNIPNNNGPSDAESIRQMTSYSLNNHTGISPPSHRLNDELDRNAYIVNYENVITPEGFAYSYDTSNGIHADENGTAYDGVKAQGSYSYTGDDGKVYTIVYTADENGFQPRGDHLPTPPPIPEAILRVIEEANRSKAAGIVDDGMYDEEKYGYQKYEGAMERLKSRHMNKPKISKQQIEIDDKNMPTYDENVSVEGEDDFGNVQDVKPHKLNDFTTGKSPKRPTSDRHGQISQDQRYVNENRPKSYSTGNGKFTESTADDIESNLPSDISNVDNVGSGQESYDYDSNPIQGSIENAQHKFATDNNVPRGSGRRPINPVKISKTQKTQSEPKLYDNVQQGNDEQFTTRQPIGSGYVSTDNVPRGSGRRPVNPAKISKIQETQSEPINYDNVQQDNDEQFTTRQSIGSGYVSTDNVPRGSGRRPVNPSMISEIQKTQDEPKNYDNVQQDNDEQFTTRQSIGSGYVSTDNVPRGSGRRPVNPGMISKIQKTQSVPKNYDDGDSNTFDSQHVQQGNGNQFTTRQPMRPGYVSTDKSFVGGQTRRPTTVSSRLPTIINQKGSAQEDYNEHVPERVYDYQKSSSHFSDEKDHDVNLNIPNNGEQIRYEPTRQQKYPGTNTPKITNNYEFDSSVQASTRKPSIRIQDYDEKSNGYKYLPPSNKFDQLSSTILPTGAPVTTSKQFVTKTDSSRRPFTTPGVTRTDVDDEDDIDNDKHITSTTKKPYFKYNKQNNFVPQEQIEVENTTENEEHLTNIGVNPNKPYAKHDNDYENRKPVYNLHPQFPMQFQTNHPEQNAVSSTTKPVYYPSSAPNHSTIQSSTKKVNYYPNDSSNQITRGPDYQPSTTYRPQNFRYTLHDDSSQSFAPNYPQSTESPYRQFDNSARPGVPTNNGITQSTPYPQYGTIQSDNISEFPDRHSTVAGNRIEYTGQYDSSRAPQPSNLPNIGIQFKPQDNTRKPETFDNRLNLGGSKTETRHQFGTTQTPEFGSRITQPYRVQTDITPFSRVTPTIQEYASSSTPGFTTQRTTFGNIENKNVYLPGLPSNAYDGPASAHNGIKGEDFSGPKQQPKFDPETGYHY